MLFVVRGRAAFDVKNGNLKGNNMKDEKQAWTISWTQLYNHWHNSHPEPKPKLEPEVEDLTLAREVLARIMSK